MAQVWTESKCYDYITESQIKVLEELGRQWESVSIGYGTVNGGKPHGLEDCVIVPDKHNYCQGNWLCADVGTLANQYKRKVLIEPTGETIVCGAEFWNEE